MTNIFNIFFLGEPLFWLTLYTTGPFCVVKSELYLRQAAASGRQLSPFPVQMLKKQKEVWKLSTDQNSSIKQMHAHIFQSEHRTSTCQTYRYELHETGNPFAMASWCTCSAAHRKLTVLTESCKIQLFHVKLCHYVIWTFWF